MLAKQGMPRSERRKLVRDATGTQDAAVDDTPRAVTLDPALVAETLKLLKS
jgi:hypothetical protein